jgi:Zn-dependent M16 (insulinase) family peptidase
LWDYLRIFSLALPRAGADGRSSDEMSAFIESSTGGVSAEVTVPVDGIGKKHRRFLRFGGRALERRQDDLVNSLVTLLGAGEFTPELVQSVVGGALAQAEQGVFTQATNYLRLLAGSQVRESWAKRERLFGFTHLALLRKLGQAGTGLDEVASKLLLIRDHVARLGAFQVFVAASTNEAIESLEPSLEKALSSLPMGGSQAGFFDESSSQNDLVNEVRTFGMPAAFNCEVIATPGFDHPEAIPLTVASGLMSRHISIEVVRKGTAYHAACDASTDGGSIVNWSVRDPHIARTYKSFEEARSRILKDPIDPTEFNLILRGMASRAELLEDSLRRARRVFVESHAGLDPDRFSRYGEAIAKITEADVRSAVEEHLAGTTGAKATLASKDMVESAKKDGLEFHVVSAA